MYCLAAHTEVSCLVTSLVVIQFAPLMKISCQSFYKAAVLRNPVLNVGTNLVLSDIPDWYVTSCD